MVSVLSEVGRPELGTTEPDLGSELRLPFRDKKCMRVLSENLLCLSSSPSFARGQNCSYNRAYTYKLSSVIPQASVLIELDPQRLSTPHSLAIHIYQPVRRVIPFLVHTTCAMLLAARIYPSLSKPDKLCVTSHDSDSGSVLMSIVRRAPCRQHSITSLGTSTDKKRNYSVRQLV